MPEWWLEAVLPGAVFSVMLVLWVALPARPGEWDFGARVRWLLRGGRPDAGSDDADDVVGDHANMGDEPHKERD